MKSYPMELVRELAPNNKEEGANPVFKVKPLETNPHVMDWLLEVETRDNKAVESQIASKQKAIHRMIDEGYDLEVAPNYRWHHSHRGHPNFLGKLNLANQALL